MPKKIRGYSQGLAGQVFDLPFLYFLGDQIWEHQFQINFGNKSFGLPAAKSRENMKGNGAEEGWQVVAWHISLFFDWDSLFGGKMNLFWLVFFWMGWNHQLKAYLMVRLFFCMAFHYCKSHFFGRKERRKDDGFNYLVFHSSLGNIFSFDWHSASRLEPPPLLWTLRLSRGCNPLKLLRVESRLYSHPVNL